MRSPHHDLLRTSLAREPVGCASAQQSCTGEAQGLRTSLTKVQWSPLWQSTLKVWQCRAGSDGAASDAEEAEEFGPERVYLVGVAVKGRQKRYGYTIQDSLEELARLADAAGLEVRCPPAK